MTRRILVTGANGFIGSHLVERLVRDGERVVALVHYNAIGHIDAGGRHRAMIFHRVVDFIDQQLTIGIFQNVDRHHAAPDRFGARDPKRRG